jgi:alpha-1,2-mannosyltransferase
LNNPLRPEKDHKTQIFAFHQLLREHSLASDGSDSVKLVLIGGSRNEGDAERIVALKKLVGELKIDVS